MRLLREDFGESDELDTFVTQIERRFGTFYEVRVDLDDDKSRRYFAYESAARDYYNKIKESVSEDKDYYTNSSITLSKVRVNLNKEEIDTYDNDEDFSDDIETDFEEDNI